MNQWVDLKGGIIGSNVYENGQIIAKEVDATLPSIAYMTGEYRAMGNMTMPIPFRLESMELTVTKIGVDKGMGSMIIPNGKILEFRWVQDVLKADGTQKPEGCKAFIRCTPKSLGGAPIAPGSPSSMDTTFEVTRFQLFTGGEEIFLIDRLSQIFKINGTNYFEEIKSML